MTFDQGQIVRLLQELQDLSADRHRIWRDLEAAKQRIEELDRLRIEQDRWYREHCEDQVKLAETVETLRQQGNAHQASLRDFSRMATDILAKLAGFSAALEELDQRAGG